MELIAQDVDWTQIRRKIISELSSLRLNGADADWVILVFAITHLKSDSDFQLDRLSTPEELIDKIGGYFQRDSYGIKIALHGLSDEVFASCHDVVRNHLLIINNDGVRNFIIFIINHILSAGYGVTANYSRVSAFLTAGIVESLNCKSIVDVQPITGQIAIDSKFNSYHMIADNRSGESELIKLKLEMHGVRYTEFDFNGIPDFPVKNPVYVLDLNRRDVQVSSTLKIPKITPLQDLLSIGVRGEFVVLTPQFRKKSHNYALKVLNLVAQNYSVNAVISFSAPTARSHSYGMLIVATSDTSHGIDEVLEIDVSRNNPAIKDLGYLDAANLASSIHSIWAQRGSSPNRMLPTVQRIINAQFSNGYTDIPSLCRVLRRQRGGSFQSSDFMEVSDHGKDSYQPSLLINGAPILENLIESQTNKCLYIIGNNGVGKSFLLCDLIHQLAERRMECTALSVSRVDRFPKATGELKRYYKQIGESQSLAKRSEASTKSLISILESSRRFSIFAAILIELGFNQEVYLLRKRKTEKLSEDEYSAISLNLSNSRDQEAIDAARQVDPAKYEIGIVPRQDRETHSHNHDVIIPFSDLSSGERNIIQLIAFLVSAADPNTTYFIDEPEISLHVRWQQVLPKAFSILAEAFDISVVVATHSPVMIANAADSNSYCYNVNEGVLDLLDLEDRHSVETILLQGFHTYTPHNREVHEKCARLVSGVIELVNTDAREASNFGSSAIKDLSTISDIIDKTAKHDKGAQKYGDLDLIHKAITAIRSVIQVG
ncbi:AAA family ATPase [Pseudomonas sp. WHRI 8519]|uniref:AAA family ATPase n=1 Tax=Pseudomonas sp. WHRI 8519 TaxID=3162567 RepID=UPI0032EDA043